MKRKQYLQEIAKQLMERALKPTQEDRRILRVAWLSGVCYVLSIGVTLLTGSVWFFYGGLLVLLVVIVIALSLRIRDIARRIKYDDDNTGEVSIRN